MNVKHPPPPLKVGTRWSEQEINMLIGNFGYFHIDTVAKKIGRTPSAVEDMARKLRLKQEKSGKTLQQLSNETGYPCITLLRVMRKFDITCRKRSTVNVGRKPRAYAISDEIEEKILSILKEYGTGAEGSLRYRPKAGSWEKRDPPHCVSCGGTERYHKARGLCWACYRKLSPLKR